MKECRFVFQSVPVGPTYYANGPSMVVGRCETHGQLAQPGDVLCPIGQVEKAVEDGLAKINETLNLSRI